MSSQSDASAPTRRYRQPAASPAVSLAVALDWVQRGVERERIEFVGWTQQLCTSARVRREEMVRRGPVGSCESWIPRFLFFVFGGVVLLRLRLRHTQGLSCAK